MQFNRLIDEFPMDKLLAKHLKKLFLHSEQWTSKIKTDFYAVVKEMNALVMKSQKQKGDENCFIYYSFAHTRSQEKNLKQLGFRSLLIILQKARRYL